jgi:ADP-heptose:LPS heptosyltransferase
MGKKHTNKQYYSVIQQKKNVKMALASWAREKKFKIGIKLQHSKRTVQILDRVEERRVLNDIEYFLRQEVKEHKHAL